jgi:energy-coupling factor transporter ATP-binding protein EcfA2
MSVDTKDAMYFRSLYLENVRAFGRSQCLELSNENGSVSLWNLILGENGVGKTTLMQALAVMRPVAAKDERSKKKSAVPTLSRVQLADRDDDSEIMHFIRRDGTGTTRMTAVLETSRKKRLEVGVDIRGNTNELKAVEYRDARHKLRSKGPLVVGYGAGRHVGHFNLSAVAGRESTGSLFADATDLYDAEDLIEKLHYAARIDRKGGPDVRRLRMLKEAVASLLPHGFAAKDIQIRGPRYEGRDPDRSGVHVKTPSGVTPLADLSLGYQTMFAWTVDLAWRLFNAFPQSLAPLSESAIVLIDEVDLHLHPRWQRDLRQHLLKHFPKVQFIATTHSPITAQEALCAGGTVAVVRWEGDEAHILNRPISRREWRWDQLLTSELFGFGSDRDQETEKKLYERVALVRKANRTREEETRLRHLDKFVASLPTASSPIAQEFEDLMMEMARDFPR